MLTDAARFEKSGLVLLIRTTENAAYENPELVVRSAEELLLKGTIRL
jgi:hypothetical protein